MLAYQRVSRLYAARGTARDAEAFASEGVELATSLAAPLSLSQALVLRSELRLQLGQGENVEADLALGLELLNEEWIPEAVALACIRGDSLRKLNAFGDALASYSAGQSTLLQLNGAFSDMELILPSPRPPQRVSQGSATPSSRRTTATTDPLLPDVQGRLLRRQAWLLQLLARDGDSQIALEQAANLEADEEGRVDDALVHGRIALRRTLQQLQADQVLSLLPESALSMPMATGASSKSLSATGKSTLTVLAAAEAAFRAALASGRARSHVTQVREAYTSLAVVYTLQATLGKAAVKGAAASTANLIGVYHCPQLYLLNLADIFCVERTDLGSSITLRREYLDAIEHKLHPRASQDDTKWLTFDTGLERSMQKLALTADSEDEDDIQIWSRDSYWRATQRRYLAEHESSELVPAVKLPHDWTVVSISLDMERNTILLSRQGGGREPVVFSLPVDRQCRREGEEEELTIPAALEELKDIVYSCNTAVHGAKDLQGMDARKAWWTERRALDKRLETLLTAIENRWLGAFKVSRRRGRI